MPIWSVKGTQWRVLFHAIFLFAGIPAGCYIASGLWLLFNKINTTQASFGEMLWAWLTALQAYRAGYPVNGSKLAWAGGIAFTAIYIVPIHIWLSGALRRRVKLHGDARFAKTSEVKKAGLFSDSGIVIGKYNGQLLRFTGQQFVLLAAPTRSGKGVGIVIPNLLSYEGSVVVFDPKQENFNYTATFRSTTLGQEVFLFNPFAEDLERDANGKEIPNGRPAPRTARFNFLSSISSGVFRVGDILMIANALWPTGGKDAFWNDSARNLFLAIVLFLLELRDHKNEVDDPKLPVYPVTMGEVLRQSSGRGSGLSIKKYFQKIVNDYDWLSAECRDSMANFLSASDDVLASITSTFNAPLTIWRNPIVDAATSANDFNLEDVRKKLMTIYIGITPDHLEDAKLIVNLLFSQLVNLNTKQLPQDNPEVLKYPCMLLMDEFTSMGKVNILAKAVSYIAGYNLRLFPIIQSIAQLESVYGKEDTRTFITNHAMQIIFAPREQKDANDYSEMLGTYTLKNASMSRSREIFGNKGPSESISDQKRALMMPQELKEIGQWKEIIFLENVKPIMAEKIRYFDDPLFKPLVAPPPVVQPLDIDLILAKSEDAKRDAVETDIDHDRDRIRNPEHLALLNDQVSDLPPTIGSLEDEVVLAGLMFGDSENPYTELVNATPEFLARQALEEIDFLVQIDAKNVDNTAPPIVVIGGQELSAQDLSMFTESESAIEHVTSDDESIFD